MLNRTYPFNLLYRLNNINRYATIPRLSNESVTTHLYHVAAIVLELYLTYEFNLEKALVMALVHDMPEVEIDDVSHATKSKHPDIAKALKNAEIEIVSKYPEYLKNAFIEFENAVSVEAIIVQFADADQCTQYADYEINYLGNNSKHMNDIYNNSVNRVNELTKKLEQYKRK